MKFILILLFTCTASISCKDEPKVQIGIKRRVDCNDSSKTRRGDFVHVHYKGTLQKDGIEFDSSYPRGNAFTFTLGSNQVIKGWDQGLLGMCEGEKRRLVIPPELGYGKSGSGSKIPPDSTLIFEVELLKIEKRQEL
ncbi:peptidyl-prolyl cis-trans isomerase FKBP2 [Condylostylus longicornis]|uniref:peptidyl-prolyl cis-trans isomerase FKBP2 n=1 Tax=Condylostylus longicornis TaxID=2530218 RepID=UPI00244E042B|nr:peptidyl-prolyl cis-trans isomerase FKBP2 [Condylostylus longicornis]